MATCRSASTQEARHQATDPKPDGPGLLCHLRGHVFGLCGGAFTGPPPSGPCLELHRLWGHPVVEGAHSRRRRWHLGKIRGASLHFVFFVAFAFCISTAFCSHYNPEGGHVGPWPAIGCPSVPDNWRHWTWTAKHVCTEFTSQSTPTNCN